MIFAIDQLELGESLLANAVEILVLVVGITTVLGAGIRLPPVRKIFKWVFQPAVRAVILEPAEKKVAELIGEVVDAKLAPFKSDLERQFGGNGGGIREAVNKISVSVEDQREGIVTIAEMVVATNKDLTDHMRYVGTKDVAIAEQFAAIQEQINAIAATTPKNRRKEDTES